MSSPGGVYLQWEGQLVWMHAVSNVLNAAACFLIPLVIFSILKRRRDIVPLWVSVLLCLPLVFSGLTYTVMAVNIWYPNYWLSGLTKLVCCIASLIILGLLIHFKPQLLAIPSPLDARRNERKISRIYRFLRPLVNRSGGREEIPSNQLDTVGRYVRELAIAKKSLEQSNAAQTRFLANMSHEIRTPLAGIMGYSDQLLFDPHLLSRHRESVEAIKKCTDHLKYMLNDILDVAKMEAGRLVIQKEDCSLMSILHDVVTIMQGKIHSKNLELRAVFETPIPERIITDPLRLRQILLNLLGNAAKFTDTGLICLRLSVRDLHASGQGILDIVIADTGCGIPVEFHTHLFKRFSQAESANKMRNAGSGLGLFISRTLARQLGGDVTFLGSHLNQGSSFLFTLAVETPHDTLFVQDFIGHKPKADASVKPNPIEGQLADLSILVVEDGADNQRIFNHFLKMAGAKVSIVEDGPTALARALEDKSIDLVLMDIQIPGMDGYEVTSRLRKSGFSKPIIAVTAHSQTGETSKQQLDISDFLAKPVDIENLIQTVQRHARRAQQREMREALAPSSAESGNDRRLLSKYHDNRIYRDIIIAFIHSFEQKVEDIQAMIHEMDWEKLGFALHQIKGAAATYGFPQVSETAAQMEHSAQNARRDAHAVQAIQQQVESMRGLSLRMKDGLPSLENRPG